MRSYWLKTHVLPEYKKEKACFIVFRHITYDTREM